MAERADGASGSGPGGDPAAGATLRALLDTIQDVFYRVDREGRLTLISRSGLAELGVAGLADLLGRPTTDFWLQPSDRARMMEALRRDGEVRDWVLEIRRGDGRTITVATSVRLLRDERGAETGYEGIFRNVTERAQAEARLRQSEEKFSKVFQTLPDTLVVTRARDGLLLDVNPGFEAATGWSREDAVGRSTLELALWTDPAQREAMVAGLRRDGEVLHQRFTFRRRDGVHREGVYSARSLAIGSEPCVLFIMQDVTEQREAERALARHEQRLRLALDGASLGTWDWEPATGRVVVNERWAEMLGWRLDEVPDPFALWERSLHPDDAPRARQALADHLEGRAPTYEAEFRLRHRSGDWVWVLVRGRVLERDEAGRPSRVCGTHLDVSPRRRLEAAQASLEARLRQSQKLEAVGQVAGGVAHDFNNLLTVQFGALEALAALPGLPPEAQEILGELDQSARAAAKLTRQLLAFSRRQVLQVRRVDLNAVLDGFLGMLRRVLREDVRLAFLPYGDPLWLDADVGMLEQVVMNLAVNARDAMPAGGLLTVACRAVELTEADAARHPSARPGRWARLEVTDTGEGMEEATLRRLFEPFFTTKGPGHGTGLGLATVYGIVEQHRGWIEVESRPGAGARFRVHYPVAAAPPEARPAAGTGRPPSSGAGQLVLLVEDAPAVRRTLRAWLERLGYQVVEAADGPEALERWRAERDRIRLVLSDVVMPRGMTGLELVRRLRAEAPDLPAVVMSGYSGDLVAGGRPEDVGFLAKPCGADTLAAALEWELAGRRR